MNIPALNGSKLVNFSLKSAKRALENENDGRHIFYSMPQFQNMLRIERKRTERSQKPFVLMLLDFSGMNDRERNSCYERIKPVLISCSRETDIRGWYDYNVTMGAIFTEMASVDQSSIEKIFRKFHGRISETIDVEFTEKIKISFHVFPDGEAYSATNHDSFNPSLYPDLAKSSISREAALFLKKLMDITGSLIALICLSPLFLIIAAAIKMTSEGPVLFKQVRVGLNGEPFLFLKFRSMYASNGHNHHKDYIKKFISEGKNNENASGVYKLTNDPRITPLGGFLRKTSLDELPQFINVLKGEMSLVGPRPPIPYECELYDIWHRRRLLSVKPGITGLWQTTGRSSTTFDDMVRLDIKYINEWSLWLDIKLLLKTPGVVLTFKGAH